MQIGGRRLDTIVRAPFEKRHRIAAVNMFRRYVHPVEILRRYLLGYGTYPATVPVKTPIGQISLNGYSRHDILTINEIFCRLDYRSDDTDKVVVDFGSNIGVSAAYFLTESSQAHAYLFEPLSFNIERLHKNLAPFEGRYTLSEVAVGLVDGEVQFGWEESGRYGGVGAQTGNYISVRCVDSNRVLADIAKRHERIDLLKIDIETLEEPVTSRIPFEIAKKIKKIYVEYPFSSNPLERTHSFTQYGAVAQFINKEMD